MCYKQIQHFMLHLLCYLGISFSGLRPTFTNFMDDQDFTGILYKNHSDIDFIVTNQLELSDNTLAWNSLLYKNINETSLKNLQFSILAGLKWTGKQGLHRREEK